MDKNLYGTTRMALRAFLGLLIAGFSMTSSYSQDTQLRVEPPFWWAGMCDSNLQLLVHGNDIGETHILPFSYPGVRLAGVHGALSKNYLFVDLVISKEARPGKFLLLFEYQREIVATCEYELMERRPGAKEREGFGTSDVIYLAMPDRFSNGDAYNDTVPGMLEGSDRSDPDGRHGGDLQGIIDHLDYIAELGMTALWLNPVLENNMPHNSYHGYAITDYYRVDPRLGDNRLYLELVRKAHEKGLKVIMDMVFNHCGSKHWWMDDLPYDDWIHQFPEFTRSNYRSETVMDPHASEYDRHLMKTGWFDITMPDLNQQNVFLGNYLIQNSIWWVEYADLDGIRMDTYPYSDSDFMIRWMERVKKEYPEFSVLGETWLQKESHTAFFQEKSPGYEGYNSHLPFVTDFPLHYALIDAFNEPEGWTSGLSRLYYILTQDYLYSEPMHTVIFADNHDLTRYFTSLGKDPANWKMGMAVLLTTRGIPIVYYGTEILMTGREEEGHGFIRQDFPGGWPGDTINVFTMEGLNREQIDALDYVRVLVNWRKDSETIHDGRLKQFVPQDGIYVYCRYSGDDMLMVIINKNPQASSLGLDRFIECTGGYSYGRDVFTGKDFPMEDQLDLPPSSALVLELMR